MRAYEHKYPETKVASQIEALFHAHPIKKGHNPSFCLVYADPGHPSDRVLVRVKTMAGCNEGCEPGKIVLNYHERAFEIAYGHSISPDGIRSVDIILEVHPRTSFVIVAGGDRLHRRFKVVYSGEGPPTFTEITPHP